MELFADHLPVHRQGLGLRLRPCPQPFAFFRISYCLEVAMMEKCGLHDAMLTMYMLVSMLQLVQRL